MKESRTRRLARHRPRHALFPRAADRHLRVLAAHAPRRLFSFDAYRVVLADPRFQATFGYSTVLAIATIVVGVLLVVPTAYWVRLRAAAAAPDRRVHHAAAAGHPGDRHRLRLHPALQLAPRSSRSRPMQRGTDLLLTFGYVTLGAALHVPGGRHRASHHRRAHADRGRRDPRRRLADDPLHGDLPQRPRRGAVAAPS